MTSKAEELAKRLVRSWREEMSSQSLEAQLVAALREYGAEVRRRAVGVCMELPLTEDDVDDLAEEIIHTNCAAAINREPLP